MSRRKKNPLLGRILVVSVAVHVVALPVLAYFGAFKKVQASIMGPVVEVVPPPAPPEKEPPPPEEKKEDEKKPDAPKENQGEKEAKAPLNQPRVAAASGDGGPSSTPTVNPEGTGKAGEVPTVAGNGTGNGTANANPSRPETPAVTPRPEAKAEPSVKPPAPTVPVEAAPKATPPHVPVLASAEPIDQPLPEVPDDLRAESLDKSTVVMVVVNASGKADSVSLASSSGMPELDELALKAVRRWTFRAATRDGEPVSGKVCVHVRFKVEG